MCIYEDLAYSEQDLSSILKGFVGIYFLLKVFDSTRIKSPIKSPIESLSNRLKE